MNQKAELVTCPHCFKLFKPRGIAGHIWSMHTDEGRARKNELNKEHSKRVKNSTPWNKGLTSDTDERIKKQGENLSEKYKSGECKKSTGICNTPERELERRKKLSKVAKDRGFGGYQKKSGRGKKGWYKDFYCDSSYELAFVIFHLENNIFFERNTKKFDYIFEGEKLRWMPDFIINGRYVEIKGYMSEQNKAKIYHFKHPLLILTETNMDFIFNYVTKKYGKNYIEMYEKR